MTGAVQPENGTRVSRFKQVFGGRSSTDPWLALAAPTALRRLREEILPSAVSAGERVLLLGGDRELADRLAGRGAAVVRVDSSPPGAGDGSTSGEGRRLTPLELADAFPTEHFDRVICLFELDRLSGPQATSVLAQVRRLVRREGTLILAEPTVAERRLLRPVIATLRWPLRLLAFLGAQAGDLEPGRPVRSTLFYIIELPLMLLTFLVVPPARRPLRGLAGQVSAAAFAVREERAFAGGTLRLVRADPDPCAALPPVEAEPAPRPAAEAEGRGGPAAVLRLAGRRLFQLFFRMVPFPTEPRLIRVGDPDRGSPVLLTSNFDLTVRRVCRDLRGLDAYLLVAPAGGLDVWCAAGGGRLSVDSVVSILRTSGVARLVDHRRLLLPQLAAGGIDLADLHRRTGWWGVFGPAWAHDLQDFLVTGRRTREMSWVTFTIRERFEMAAALWGSLSLRYTLFPCLVLGWAAAPAFVTILALLAVAVSLGCFHLPGRTFVQKVGVLGVGGSAVLAAAPWLGATGGAAFPHLQWIVLLLFGSFLVGTAFPSYAPYWPCGYSSFFFGDCPTVPDFDEGSCIGCGVCQAVCPVDCFRPAGATVVLARPDACLGCGACSLQCPTGALGGIAGGEACGGAA